MGIHHGCRAVVQVYNSLAQPVRSIEDTIIPCPGIDRFAKPGDSGALLYDAQGTGQFMVWGGLSLQGPTAVAVERVVFATPMQAILDGIEAKLALWLGHNNFRITLLQ